MLLATGTCLPSLCLETGLVYLPILRSSHGNVSTCYSMYVMAAKPISMAYFINPSLQSVYLYVSMYVCIPPFCARQRLGKHIPAVTNTCYSRRIVGHIIFYVGCLLSKEGLWGSVCVSPYHCWVTTW
jgi:hypothetical protein